VGKSQFYTLFETVNFKSVFLYRTTFLLCFCLATKKIKQHSLRLRTFRHNFTVMRKSQLCDLLMLYFRQFILTNLQAVGILRFLHQCPGLKFPDGLRFTTGLKHLK
jgi:hypothetical protein